MFSSVVAVAGLILLRTDPVIIKLYLPLSAVAVYAVALKIAEYGILLTKQLINVLTPLMAELHGSGDGEKIRFLLLNANKFAMAPAVAGVVAVGLLGREALGLWVGPEFSAGWPVLFILTAAGLASVPQMMASNVLTMTGHHRFTAFAALASVAVNLAGSLLLIRPFGLTGVAMGTLIATISIDLFLVLPRALRLHGVRAGAFLRRVVPPLVVPATAQLTLTWGMKEAFPPGSLLGLALISLPGLAAFAGAFWLLGMDASERSLVTRRAFGRLPSGKPLAGAEA